MGKLPPPARWAGGRRSYRFMRRRRIRGRSRCDAAKEPTLWQLRWSQLSIGPNYWHYLIGLSYIQHLFPMKLQEMGLEMSFVWHSGGQRTKARRRWPRMRAADMLSLHELSSLPLVSCHGHQSSRRTGLPGYLPPRSCLLASFPS